MQRSPIILSPSRIEGTAGDPYLSPDDVYGEGLISIEGTALQFGILPVDLPRQACTADAESLVRLLGRTPHTSSPWLPVSTLGPLLILAHHNPRCEDNWGVPEFLSIKIVISPDQYETIRQDLVMRVSTRPIRDESPFEGLFRPSISAGDLKGAFEWLIDVYPLSDNQKINLVRAYRDLLNRQPEPCISDFNGLQQNLGVALQ